MTKKSIRINKINFSEKQRKADYKRSHEGMLRIYKTIKSKQDT